MRRARGIAFAVGVAAAVSGFTRVSPHGPELQLNETTSGAQRHARVAVGDQQFLAVWDSASSPGSDSDGLSIQARRYTASGSPLGPQFQVNEWTTGNQGYPAVASNGASSAVVVFESSAAYNGDTSGIQGQWLSLTEGTSNFFLVNSYTTSLQRRPSVAMGANGSFVVVWESGGSYGDDSSGFSIQARRYFAGGSPAGPQFQVNTYTTLGQVTPAVAVAEDGSFFVTWHDPLHLLDPTGGIFCQGFDADGNSVGFESMVPSYTTGAQRAPAVAALPGGEFVVAWESFGSDTGDAGSYSIQARRMGAGGVPSGYQFQVNSYTTGAQRFPAPASNTRGNFVVVWQSEGSFGNDASSLSIQTRQFRGDDSPLAPERQVNSYPTSLQQTPAVDTDSDGNFVVVWEGFGSSGNDNDSYSVHGRRFDGLFRDGFENGGTTRWSPVQP